MDYFYSFVVLSGTDWYPYTQEELTGYKSTNTLEDLLQGLEGRYKKNAEYVLLKTPASAKK